MFILDHMETSYSWPGTIVEKCGSPGFRAGEQLTLYHPLVPPGNCARDLPMVLIGTGLQGDDHVHRSPMNCRSRD